MIPIRDDAPRYSTPYVNYFLLTVNIVVFLAMWLSGQRGAQMAVDIFGYYPARIVGLVQGVSEVRVASGVVLPVNSAAVATIFTSMFMHASWLHLIGNMVFLWIFGDNVEDILGHIPYLLFYLAGGVVAAAAQIFFTPTSSIPSLGASGAIAAVLGAYIVMFPRARVRTLVFVGIIFVTRVSAIIFLGIWFIIQLFSGVTSLGADTAQTSGVAFWAHIGGFIFGLVVGLLFRGRASRAMYARY